MPVFVYPLMLVGLVAVATPVVIHFLTRPKPRALRFPAFRLLLAAGGGRQALDTLRTVLLLSLRCLALLLLVLAFSWPLWQSGASIDPDRAQRVVVVIDASASMSATQGGVPLFTQARSQAADYLTRLDRGAQAGVIIAGARPRPLLPALSANVATLHEGLREATVSYEGMDAQAALANAAQMLDGKGQIVVFSDLQRSNWGAVDFAELSGVQVLLRPVVRKGVENAGITAVDIQPGQPVAGETADIQVTVFNAAARSREVQVVLETSGVSMQRALALSPFASGQVSFAIGQPAVGLHPGSVRLEPSDAMPSDDVRRLLLAVEPRLQALVVSDSPLHDAASGAAFAARAFDPLGDGRVGIHAARAQAQALESKQVEEASLIALVPPLNLPGEVADILARRLAEGLLLMVFCDGRERGDGHQAINSIIGASDGALSLPWHSGETVRPGDGVSPRIHGTARGPLRAFASLNNEPFAAITVQRYRQARAESASSDQVYLSYPDGTPALMVEALGRGGMSIINMPLSSAESDWVGTPLFPALLHECVRAMRSQTGGKDAAPGRPWSLVVNATGEQELQVEDPAGNPVSAQVLARGRQTRLALPPVAQPGLYPVRAGGDTVGYGVVNLDPRESDTRPVAPEDLLDSEGDTPVLVYDDDQQLAMAGKPTRWWPWLLLIAALGLAAEMLLGICWRRTSRGLLGGRS